MNQKMKKTINLMYIIAALFVFACICMMISSGFNPSWSVSRYAGASVFNWVLFMIISTAILILGVKYVRHFRRDKKFPLAWAILTLILFFGLFMIAIFPAGMFDTRWIDGKCGVISILHLVGSYIFYAANGFVTLYDLCLTKWSAKSWAGIINIFLLLTYSLTFCIDKEAFGDVFLVYEITTICSTLVYFAMLEKTTLRH